MKITLKCPCRCDDHHVYDKFQIIFNVYPSGIMLDFDALFVRKFFVRNSRKSESFRFECKQVEIFGPRLHCTALTLES